MRAKHHSNDISGQTFHKKVVIRFNDRFAVIRDIGGCLESVTECVLSGGVAIFSGQSNKYMYSRRWRLSCCTRDGEYRMMNPCLYFNKDVCQLEVLGRMTRSLPPVSIRGRPWRLFQGYEVIDRESVKGDSYILRKNVETGEYDECQPFSILCEIENSGYEDPRVFEYGGRRYVVCVYRGGDGQRCSQNLVMYDMEEKSVLYLEKKQAFEKNWGFFESESGRLMCVYRVSPLEIGELNMRTGRVEVEYRSSSGLSGVIGGGSCPVYVERYGVYLGVAHRRMECVSKERSESWMRYRNFFYTFEGDPPYRFLKSLSFEIERDSWIEFGTAVVILGDRLLVSLGVDDVESIVVEYSLREVFELLL